MVSIFNISKLRTFAAAVLDAGDYEPSDSARIRAIPDTRTIRYYTTIGLIDRPSEMKGRTAYYNRRHVEQLVVIKRMQSEGLTLSDIQERMSGLSARKLSNLAALPKDWDQAPDIEPHQAKTKRVTKPQSNLNFWERSPNSVGDQAQVQTVFRILVGDGLTLEIDSASRNVDIQKLILAAQPLIDELRDQNSQGERNE